MESLADWLQKRDYPSQRGKTKGERRLGNFVKAQKQAYLGNRPPFLTTDDICKLEELRGWTFPLPSFGGMLGKLDGPKERDMHVHRQQQPGGWIAIGYAYRRWKQALRRRSGIDVKDATPQQIAAFKRKAQFLNTNAEDEREAKRAAKREAKLEIVHDPWAGDWTDDLGPNACSDFCFR